MGKAMDPLPMVMAKVDGVVLQAPLPALTETFPLLAPTA
jgi:hypothetical protein